MKTMVVAALLAAAAAAGRAAADAPLLRGTYEVTRFVLPDGTVQKLPDALIGGTTTWGRMAFAFDGDHVTVSAAVLDRDHGTDRACEVSFTTDVAWSSTGFTVGASVAASARASDFSQLSSAAYKGAVKGCNAHLGKGAFTVTAGKSPKIENAGATFYLAPSTEEIDKIDWRKHVR